MKHFRLLTIVSLLIIGGISCTHKSHQYVVHGDYLAVGTVGGFVNTNTYQFYLISNGEFREDPAVPATTVRTKISDFNFSVLMPASKYDQVKTLPSSIPIELLSRNGETIGNYFPDMGHYVVWASVGGVTYKWYFEGDQSTSSPAVQQFVTSLAIVFQ